MTRDTGEPAVAAEPANLAQALKLSEKRYRLLVDAVSDYAIFFLDPKGIVSSWNKGAHRISGYTADEIMGQHFSRFYPQEALDRGWPDHELQVARASGRFEDEGWRLRKDGSQYWASVIITALYDDNGEVWGFAKITRDLSERRLQEESLRISEERFRLLVEGVKDCAIFMLDPNGCVISWNAGAENIKGYRAEEIIGQHFSRFYTQEDIDRKWPDYELHMAKAQGAFEDEGWRLRKDGERFWANVLITALHDSQNNLIGFAKVTRDLTARRRLEALELAEQRMKEFLALLSHELRNPLAPIRSALGAMEMADATDPVQEQARGVIERQVAQISRLVDDLLDVSRVTAGNIRLDRKPVDLREAVERAVEASMPSIEEHKQRLFQELAPEPVWVRGDLVRLTQVILNLLNNASRYTPDQGEITLRLEKDADNARVRILDTGVGIAPDEMDHLFSLFAQGGNELERRQAGLGIGLSLSKYLVDMHKGTISAFSEGRHCGSEFVVQLPLLVAGDDAGAEAAAGAATSSTLSNTSRRSRILLVEDLPDVAEALLMVLQLWGHTVKHVETGAGALEIAREFQPDTVLLDIGLPGMDGYETAKLLRQLPELQSATLVALTGYGQPSDKDKAFAAGFDHHLVKGESLEALEKVLALPNRGR